MIPITLGINRDTGRKFSLKKDTFRTHFHLIGATGTGKTTAIETMIRPILMDTRPKACFFIVDLMGGLSEELLRWIASKRLCPDHVRERLLYIEPAREDRIITLKQRIAGHYKEWLKAKGSRMGLEPHHRGSLLQRLRTLQCGLGVGFPFPPAFEAGE